MLCQPDEGVGARGPPSPMSERQDDQEPPTESARPWFREAGRPQPNVEVTDPPLQKCVGSVSL